MSYAILRTFKHSHWGNIGGSAGHTDRVGDMAPNADPERRHLNQTLVGNPGEIVAEAKHRLAAVTSTPRANAVLAVEFFMGFSPEWIQGKSEEDLAAWTKSNVAWLKERFGAENVVHVTLHRDETTPHLAAYIIPELGGKLNARGLLGGREKLRELQTAYAAAMAPFGLERGVEGSKAHHVPVKKFYAEVNRLGAAAHRHLDRLGEPTPPPVMPPLAGKKARGEAVAAWTAQERSRTTKLVTTAAGAFLAASTARDRADQLRHENGRAMEDVQDLRIKLTEAYEQLGLSKDQVGALRRSDISLVAQRLGHLGEILPKENSIDLVRRVNNFDFGQAVAWLHHELGPVQAGALVTAALQDREPKRPLTPAENVMRRAIAHQTDALGCDRYRVTLVPADDARKPYLPGKNGGKDTPERFYSRAELVDLVPWLRFKNNTGDNIFITPMDDNAFYILLDDVKVSREELERQGFKPCIVQRTSWESEQMVFKVPRDLSREAVLAVFNDLNRRMGDPEMTGLRHPFRLAGFRNMKPKHQRDGGQRPFVEIVEAVNRFCTRCIDLVRQQVQVPKDLPM